MLFSLSGEQIVDHIPNCCHYQVYRLSTTSQIVFMTRRADCEPHPKLPAAHQQAGSAEHTARIRPRVCHGEAAGPKARLRPGDVLLE